LIARTGKKAATLLPLALEFVAKSTRPLFDKIDAIHFTQMSRILKVAEEYAARLLLPQSVTSASKEQWEGARHKARRLVYDYPDHEFHIDVEEARRIGLPVVEPSEEQQQIFDQLVPMLADGITAIGQIVEVSDEE